MAFHDTRRFCSQWYFSILSLAKKTLVDVESDNVSISSGKRTVQIPLISLDLKIHDGWFWVDVFATNPVDTIKIRGLSKENADSLVQLLKRRVEENEQNIADQLDKYVLWITPIRNAFVKEMNRDHYLAAHHREDMIDPLISAKYEIEKVHRYVRVVDETKFSKRSQIEEKTTLLLKYLSDSRLIDARNDRFVDREYCVHKSFFDHCESSPLTEEQAKAVITFEENTLLIAAAGSGKTSVVVAKVLYALMKGIVEADDILCLAFNSDAAKEIKTRIKSRLTHVVKDSTPLDESIKARFREVIAEGDVESLTYHALGRKVVSLEKNSKGVLKPFEAEDCFKKALANCKENPEFLSAWMMLQTVYRKQLPETTRFETEKEYNEYLQTIWNDKSQHEEGIRTLGCTKRVRSFDEAEISNWLYVNGIEFEYERRFPEGEALISHKWEPDFTYTIMQGDESIFVVHEHFGLDKKGKAPHWFKNPIAYEEEAKQKIERLKELDERHFWTTSAQLRDETLFDVLEKKLKQLGVVFRPRTPSEVLTRLKAIGKDEDLTLVKSAVSQIRQNRLSETEISQRLSEQPEQHRARFFLKVITSLSDQVNKEIENTGKLDFDAMMYQSIEILRDNPKILPKKLIVADEFQDTAIGRAKMLKYLLRGHHEGKLFAVGDDWQAINRFAGSDLSIFKNVSGVFNKRKDAYTQKELTKTFRSNQGIALAARSFILAKGNQIDKTVEAQDKTEHGVIDVNTYYSDRDLSSTIYQWVEEKVTSHPKGKKPVILILGRNNPDLIKGIDKEWVNSFRAYWKDKVDFLAVTDKKTKQKTPSPYLTMHSSKGLQADYVILVGMYSMKFNFMCFPSERETDPLSDLTLPKLDGPRESEERRLMYVAMTRAKRNLLITMHDKYPSTFVTEVIRQNRDGKVLFNGSAVLPPICSQCSTGVILEKFKKDGGSYTVCSNTTGCRSYSRRTY